MDNKRFLMGAATSAYQIEGGFEEDDKSLSIWDEFASDKSNIKDKTNGNIACDSYHKVDEDISLLKELGVNCYRFSLAWTRILPTGFGGAVNKKGLQYYSDLIDKLIKNHIEPIVTIYHWDMPSSLSVLGGLLNPDFSKWLSNFSKVVAQAFKGRVRYYIIINEPQCIIGQGYVNGDHAPGWKVSKKEAFQAAFNLLKAYGASYDEIKSIDPQAQISIATTGSVYVPKDHMSEEICSSLMFHSDYNYPWFSMALYLDPIFFGEYPLDFYKEFKGELPELTEDDLAKMHRAPDFLSLNVYSGIVMRNGQTVDNTKEGIKTADIPWEQIVPQACYYGPKFLYERYKKPIFITENGMCDNTVPDKDNKIHDIRRIDYLTSYLKELMRAKEDGVNIIGYTEWSLLDNFEWACGYSMRFGLVYLDFPSTKRIKKDSFYAYKALIKKYIV